MNWFGSDEPQEPKKVDPLAWEMLTDEEDFGTWRRRVPGGWLVRTAEEYYHGGGEALCFLPDPNHEWRLNK